jgi:hypothetical protein
MTHRASKSRAPALRALAFALLLGLGARAGLAADTCAQETQWKPSGTQRHFVVLAGRTNVFFERSGPTFVMVLKSSGNAVDVGAFGIHSADGRPAFGAVPAAEYEQFLAEPGFDESRVMLRMEISGPQYERVLEVLRTWDRRVRERTLLYPEIALDNILLVKQATAELNRCREFLVPYELDWGLQDSISEHNGALRIPFEYFLELKRRNTKLHVPDTAMPTALVAAADTAGHTRISMQKHGGE